MTGAAAPFAPALKRALIPRPLSPVSSNIEISKIWKGPWISKTVANEVAGPKMSNRFIVKAHKYLLTYLGRCQILGGHNLGETKILGGYK